MTLDQNSSSLSDPPLIARSRLAAGQWEAVLAGSEPLIDRQAWLRPDCLSLSGWLELRWENARLAGSAAHDRCLLSTAQARRLWQSVIDESPEGVELIDTASIADWAQAARRGLLEQGIAPRMQLWQGSAAQTAWLRWNHEFEQALQRQAWIDADSLLYELNRHPESDAPGNLTLLDPPVELAPELERMLADRRTAGAHIRIEWPAPCTAQRRMLIAGNPDDELDRAVEWAAERLEREQPRRLAVVVPDLDTRLTEVGQAFSDHLGSGLVGSAKGRPASDMAILGAAVNVLRLLSPRADFGVVSRWLRSPFFATGDADQARQAATFERWFRTDPRSQQNFVEAWRERGLRSELARRLPQTAARIDQVLDRMPHRASPTNWAAFWQASLRILGWQGAQPAATDPWREPWERGLAGLAALTPIIGLLDASAALDELEHLLGKQQLVAPMPIHGVHLLARIDDVGPGFDGAWVMGFSERNWPEPAMPNPLLPWPVQQTHRIPGAEPQAALAAANKNLERLLARVPELVLSCPARVLDQPQVPNPRFNDWQEHALEPPRASSRANFAALRIGARERESLADPAPALIGNRIPGGARTLDLQSACPVLAFATIRLAAEPLESPARGIDARLRGILVHRALEIFLRSDADDRDGAAAAAVAELLPAGDAAWQTQVAAEQVRIERMMRALLELESGRPEFATIAIERRTRIMLAGREISCRIDRIDELAAGGEILLDYKTGKRTSADWFNERLGDCQLPLYAQHSGSATAAIALIVLNEEGARVRAAGPAADGFPGRQTLIAAADWPAQINRWRLQLASLVEEFAGGDVRIRSDQRELAGDAYGALTRIRSQPE